jgi:Right handed beta helix region
MRRIITGVWAMTLLPSYSFATDGQKLIDQSIVTAAGGFPYKITTPGSYKLSGNLAASSSVISIIADNVTLDLNGFTLSCTSCGVNSFSIVGINSTGQSTRILNGTVMGFPGGGTTFNNDLGVVDHVAMLGNGVGVQQENGSLTVTNSTVIGNESTAQGIVSGASGVLMVANSQISNNGGDGITIRSSGLVTASSVVGNLGGGIVVAGSSSTTVTLTNNLISGNAVSDLRVISGGAAYGMNTFSSSAVTSMKNNVCGSGSC